MNNTITQYIPQRDPIVMVDKVLEYSMEKIVATFEVKNDNICLEGNFFTEPGLIENIAQSAAAGFGAYDLDRGGEIGLGFIGAIGKFKLFRRPKVGEVITTRITVQRKVMNIIMIKGENYNENGSCSECEMKIVTDIPKDALSQKMD